MCPVSDERKDEQMSKTVRIRHWWSGAHAPYPNQFHDPDTDERLDRRAVLDELLEAAYVYDGAVVTISLQVREGRDRESHWQLVAPHEYRRVDGPSPKANLNVERNVMKRGSSRV